MRVRSPGGRFWRVFLVSMLVAFVPLALAATAGEWSVDAVLKQIDKATKGVGGLTGSVSVLDRQGDASPTEVSGRVAIRTDGRMRIDIEGDSAKTLLSLPGTLFIYEPGRSLVTQYPTAKHPDKLSQYAIVGFAPVGTGLREEYLVTLLEESTLGNSSVLVLELTPKAKSQRESVSKIQLWIDQANWLPLQQRIFHGGPDTHLTLRYSGLARKDKMEGRIFAPKWPKGTRKQKGG